MDKQGSPVAVEIGKLGRAAMGRAQIRVPHCITLCILILACDQSVLLFGRQVPVRLKPGPIARTQLAVAEYVEQVLVP